MDSIFHPATWTLWVVLIKWAASAPTTVGTVVPTFLLGPSELEPMSKPSTPKRMTFLGLAASLALLAADPASASIFDDYYLGTPVATSYAVPSYLTTGFAYPTVYSSSWSPTVYSSSWSPTVYSSSWSPTVYQTTSGLGYVVRPTGYVTTTSGGLFRRAWRPLLGRWRNSYDEVIPTYAAYATTGYVATSSPIVYAPTSIGVVDDCVETVSTAVVPMNSVPVNSNIAGNSARNNAASGIDQTPPKSLDSRPSDGFGPARSGSTANEAQGGTETNTGGSLIEPGLDLSKPQPDYNDDGSLRVPDFGDENLGTDPGGTGTESSSYRPAPTVMTPRPGAPGLSSIRGQVVSDGTLQPQSAVKVIFANVGETFGDRIESSDANGFFNVPLPNGDWNVTVEEADGTQTAYGRVTVASGRVYDEEGRGVTSLRIHH